MAAAAGWEYPEKSNGENVPNTWGADCTDQKFGSPINLDYTYNKFNFKELHYEDEENNNMFSFTGYDKGLFILYLKFYYR